MQIARIYYPVRTLGPGERVGIWTVGCPHGCYRCSNPELWDMQADKDIPVRRIVDLIHQIRGRIDGVTITGGDPFAQPAELAQLVRLLRAEVGPDILVYTGYRLSELRACNDPAVAEALRYISVLIDGRYVDALNDNQPLRGSSNQVIHFFNESLRSRYEAYLQQPRQVQNVWVGQTLLAIGIPVRQKPGALANALRDAGIGVDSYDTLR